MLLLACTDNLDGSDPEHILKSLRINDDAVEKLLSNLTDQVVAEPENADLRGTLGLAYDANGYSASAAQCYKEAHRLAPEQPEWPYLLAILSAHESDLQAASTWMSKSLELDPQYQAGFLWQGRWHLELNQINEARTTFEKAAAIGDHPVADLGLAEVALHTGDTENAVRALEQLAKSFTHPAVYRLLGRAYRDIGEPLKAVQAQTLAKENQELTWSDTRIEEKRRFTVGFAARLGVVEDLIQQGRYSDAFLILDQLRELRPDHVGLRYQNALAELQIGESESAKNHLLHAISIDGSHYPSHLLLAQIYQNEGLLDESVHHLEEVRLIHPSLSTPLERLAKIHIRQGNHVEALHHIEQAIELDAKDREVFYFAGVLEGSEGNWNQAIDYFERAITVDPYYVDAHKNLARCLAESGQLIRAHRQLDTARSLGLPLEEYQVIRGWLNSLDTS